MLRVFVTLTSISLVVALTATADDPPKQLTPTERSELKAKGKELSQAGLKAYQAGKLDEAVKLFAEAVPIARRLYPKDEYPDGHADLAATLNNLGGIYWAHGKHTDAEPLFRESIDMQKRLFKGDHPQLANSLNNLGMLYKEQGKYSDAESRGREALEMVKRLFTGDNPNVAASLHNLGLLYKEQAKYAESEVLLRESLGMARRLFKGDHPGLAVSLHSLAGLYHDLGRYAESEPLYHDALDMYKRLFKSDHAYVATSLNGLGMSYLVQGKYAESKVQLREALDMRRRLFKGDHPDVATSLSNLAGLYQEQWNYAEAEPLSREALEMRRRLFKADDPNVAISLSNLAGLYQTQGKTREAELLYREALDMNKRLFKGDHPHVVVSVNNLAASYLNQGKYGEAEPLLRDALDMNKRLFKGDHPQSAVGLTNQAALYQAMGKPADAESLYSDALAMSRRLIAGYAGQNPEGQTLNFITRLPPLTRDGFLSTAMKRNSDPSTIYAELWASKGVVAGVYEQRQQAARAATDPKAGMLLAELAAARRRRAELILAPEVKDPTTRTKREEDIKALEAKIADLDRVLRLLLPAITRAEKLANSSHTELQKLLPADAVVVDYLRYVFFDYDPRKPGEAGRSRTVGYLAFIVTKDKIAWVNLGPAAPIEAKLQTWREAIISGKAIPEAIPTEVRELLWAKVRKELPAEAKAVYISPDAALCRLPWAALPGDKPGTILLEDYAVATIPHAPFLLDKLGPPDPSARRTAGTLVVSGVKYDAELSPANPVPIVANRGDALLKPGQKLEWSFLDGAAAEGNGVAGAAKRKELSVARLGGEEATTTAVLDSLPKARHAHFATHGFFADPSFRSVFQLDPKEFEMSRGGERVGRAALRPLVMTGLVFAGANNPKTPGRGIITGEALIDLDLSGLQLAVLSACETGLGDVADGEGTFGLQRAFHLAGTRDVVASLWKVPDNATAALMAEFYRNLWTQNLTPVESLRQAQLTIYRNPGKIAELAAGFRGPLKVVPATPDDPMENPPAAAGKAHPRLWAAFMLSGAGR